jgi:hypothetical protein
MLDNRHAKAFYSNYVSETMNVTEINSTINNQIATDSIATLNYIIDLSKNLTYGTLDSEVLLDKAGFYLKNLKIHEALVCVAEAYIVAMDANSTVIEAKKGMINTISIAFQILGIIVVIVSQIVFVYKAKKKYGSVKKAFLSLNIFPEVIVTDGTEPSEEIKNMKKDEVENKIKKFPLAKMLLDDFKISFVGVILTLIGIIVGIL